MSRTHVVMLSGGVTSYLAAQRVKLRLTPGDRFVMLFADTRTEDEDLYRFLGDVEQRLGPLTRLADGRDVWDVFRDVRFLGNARVDPCSRILKRELLRAWLAANCDPTATTVYLGFNWDEAHRVARARPFWAPWQVESPMTEPPELTHKQQLAALGTIAPPRLYGLGFAHNNCGGFCVKAGQAQFAHLLRTIPARYAEHEQREQDLRDYLGKDVAIMTDRTGGQRRPLTMRAFRERLEAQGDFERDDWGACSCFDLDVA